MSVIGSRFSNQICFYHVLISRVLSTMQSMRWHGVLGIFRSCWLKWGCRQSSHEEEVAINKRHGADAIGRQSMQCNALSISNLPSAIKLKPSTSKLSPRMQISIGGVGLVVRVWLVRWFLRLSPPPQALLWPAGLIVATLCLFVPFFVPTSTDPPHHPDLSSQLTH